MKNRNKDVVNNRNGTVLLKKSFKHVVKK